MVVNFKNSFLFSFSESHLKFYAVPATLTAAWSCGCCLGVLFVLQILSGAAMACYFDPAFSCAFDSVQDVVRNTNRGWLLKSIHANNSSLIFFLAYIHLFRGLYYSVYFKNYNVWATGIVLFLLLMATAFFGYTLPWGQMSYWGSVVIINFLSAIPLIGLQLRDWIWGGPTISEKTLIRFMVLHFILPAIMLNVVYFHLWLLHSNPNGSTEPSNSILADTSVTFFPEFVFKDLYVFLFVFFFLICFCFKHPDFVLDAINYFQADPYTTPLVIKPEWYFLPFYTMLRSIVQSKLLGVLVMVSSIALFLLVPTLTNLSITTDSAYRQWHTDGFWLLLINFLLLGFLGLLPVTEFIQLLGFYLTGFHFLFFLITFSVSPVLADTEAEVFGKEKLVYADAAACSTHSLQAGGRTTSKSPFNIFWIFEVLIEPYNSDEVSLIHFFLNLNLVVNRVLKYLGLLKLCQVSSYNSYYKLFTLRITKSNMDSLLKYNWIKKSTYSCTASTVPFVPVGDYLDILPARHKVTFPRPVLRLERYIAYIVDTHTPQDMKHSLLEKKQVEWPLSDGELQVHEIRTWKW